jgi:hypothetical protein
MVQDLPVGVGQVKRVGKKGNELDAHKADDDRLDSRRSKVGMDCRGTRSTVERRRTQSLLPRKRGAATSP